MGMTVNGNAADRAAVQALLNQLCPLVRVNPNTGLVTRLAGPVADLGCCCIDNLLNSNFITTINPLAGPNSVVPGTGGNTIGACGGGATQPGPGGVQVAGAGGKMVNGPGAGSTLHIDISDNNGAGYSVLDANGKAIDDPAFIYLYHELCTGHATEITQGAANAANPEPTVIACENVFRAAQKPPYTARVGAGGGANAPGAARAPR